MPDAKVWKPLELVKVTAEYLSTKGIDNAKLDAEILLCRALGMKQRIDLYAGFESEIQPKPLAQYREMVSRRARREPVSRILGEREFMGLTFLVTPGVLSPRPETELLVEAALAFLAPPEQPKIAEPVEEAEPEDGAAELTPEMEKLLDSYAEDADEDELEDSAGQPAGSVEQPQMTLREAARKGSWRGNAAANADRAKKSAGAAGKPAQNRKRRILDLGTGSGCIAAALAAKLPEALVVAGDVSEDALATAEDNLAALKLADRVELRRGDWFAVCREGERFDAIVSNPPYLIEGDPEIWPEVSGYDPALALYGGGDGLDCYRRLAGEAARWLAPGGRIFFEVGAGQAKAVADLLRDNGFAEPAVTKDYGGVERVVSAGLHSESVGG